MFIKNHIKLSYIKISFKFSINTFEKLKKANSNAKNKIRKFYAKYLQKFKSFMQYSSETVLNEPASEIFEWLEAVTFGQNDNLLATSWSSGLFMYRIINSEIEGQNATPRFEPIKFECVEARSAGLYGLCVIPNESRVFLLFQRDSE